MDDIKKVWDYFGLNYDEERPLIIAEVGANHNGDLSLAKEMISAAKSSGVDAIKFQTSTLNGLWTNESMDSDLNVGMYKGKRRKYIEKVIFNHEEWYEISHYAKKENILFISTPFDFESVDLLDQLEVPIFKIASMDINNLKFLEYISQKGKPIILSTGMSNIDEIKNAISTCYAQNNKRLVLLHCTSIYPTPLKLANMNMMKSLKDLFEIPVGYSDHTIGFEAPMIATALGATVIEKHMTMDKRDPKNEHFMCAEPEDFKIIVEKVSEVSRSLGSAEISFLNQEKEMRNFSRRSLVTNCFLKKNTILKETMLTAKRPGLGIPPDKIDEIIGKKINKDIDKDSVIRWEDIS
tara:strand:- start:1128 stop:2180 length:1053 start_codon:yes stop_codon:yes gene_type:complete